MPEKIDLENIIERITLVCPGEFGQELGGGTVRSWGRGGMWTGQGQGGDSLEAKLFSVLLPQSFSLSQASLFFQYTFIAFTQ